MSRLTKTVLGLTIFNVIASVLFLTGLVNVSFFPGLYLVFPLAAVGYGMFVICLALEREAARFDAEQREHQDHVDPDVPPHNVESLHGPDHHESLAA
jgi:hypothetical protein